MPTVTIDCNRSQSGKINWDGLTTYVAFISPVGIAKVYDAFGIIDEEERGFYQFNTADASTGIPASNTITKVELFYNWSSGPLSSGGPDSWEWWIYMGDWIGSVLNGNVAEWTGGTLVWFESWGGAPPSSDYWIDLGETAPALINRSGNTDFKIEDQGTDTTPANASWELNLLNGITSDNRGKLRLTYVAPAAPTAAEILYTPHAGI